MPKQEIVEYKANFKAEMSEPEDGSEPVELTPAFSYSGSVTYNFAENADDAVQMFGEVPATDLINRSVKIDVQNLCRRYRTAEEAQEAANGFMPGVKRVSTAKSKDVTATEISKALSSGAITKADLEALLASL